MIQTEYKALFDEQHLCTALCLAQTNGQDPRQGPPQRGLVHGVESSGQAQRRNRRVAHHKTRAPIALQFCQRMPQGHVDEAHALLAPGRDAIG